MMYAGKEKDFSDKESGLHVLTEFPHRYYSTLSLLRSMGKILVFINFDVFF